MLPLSPSHKRPASEVPLASESSVSAVPSALSYTAASLVDATSAALPSWVTTHAAFETVANSSDLRELVSGRFWLRPRATDQDRVGTASAAEQRRKRNAEARAAAEAAHKAHIEEAMQLTPRGSSDDGGAAGFAPDEFGSPAASEVTQPLTALTRRLPLLRARSSSPEPLPAPPDTARLVEVLETVLHSQSAQTSEAEAALRSRWAGRGSGGGEGESPPPSAGGSSTGGGGGLSSDMQNQLAALRRLRAAKAAERAAGKKSADGSGGGGDDPMANLLRWVPEDAAALEDALVAGPGALAKLKAPAVALGRDGVLRSNRRPSGAAGAASKGAEAGGSAVGSSAAGAGALHGGSGGAAAAPAPSTSSWSFDHVETERILQRAFVVR